MGDNGSTEKERMAAGDAAVLLPVKEGRMEK